MVKLSTIFVNPPHALTLCGFQVSENEGLILRVVEDPVNATAPPIGQPRLYIDFLHEGDTLIQQPLANTLMPHRTSFHPYYSTQGFRVSGRSGNAELRVAEAANEVTTQMQVCFKRCSCPVIF